MLFLQTPQKSGQGLHVALETQHASHVSACARRVSRETADGRRRRHIEIAPLSARVIREVPRRTLPDKVKRRMKRSGRETGRRWTD